MTDRVNEWRRENQDDRDQSQRADRALFLTDRRFIMCRLQNATEQQRCNRGTKQIDPHPHLHCRRKRQLRQRHKHPRIEWRIPPRANRRPQVGSIPQRQLMLKRREGVKVI